MGSTLNWVSSIGLGAGLMYFLDPDRGRRRRALVRDKAKRFTNVLERGVDKTKRDVTNRMKGIAAASATHIPFRYERTADYILVARVRSRLGRLVSHPHAIQIRAHQGVVTLSGDVLASEAAELLAGVARVPGVSRVVNQLHQHEKAEHFPTLRGNEHRSQQRFDLFQAHWSPATRFLTGSTGAALAIYGARKGGLRGTAMTMAGAGLLARSWTNMEFKLLLGSQHGHGGFTIHKTLHIAAPVENVYEFWANYENFPRFMSHLKEVRETAPGRSHWVAKGPAGLAIEWDAEITQVIPMQVLAWKSVAGSVIEMEGSVRFERSDGGTRLTVQLSYQPPAGAVGHSLAKLFSADPKQAMDEDLVRLKSLLEVGKTRANGEVVRQGELTGVAKVLVAASRAN